jgi:Flp pilus assembly pilin Flp
MRSVGSQGADRSNQPNPEELNMARINLSKRIAGGKTQAGQGMTEYIIIVALVAIGAIAVYNYFGHTVQDQMSSVANGLAGDSATAKTAEADAKTQANNAATQASTAYGLKNFADKTGGL